MNDTNNDFARASEVVHKASSGVIVLPVNPSQDAIAAATSIYLALSKMAKTISLVCENPPKSDFLATDKIQNELTISGDNLVVSFPYTDGSIDKVDYSIQGESFNLIITPRQGQPKLDYDKVKYAYTGGLIEFIITVDAANLNSLGRIYTENKSQFQGKNIINIDRHLVNDFFGTVNIVSKTSSSTVELALQFLKEIQTEIDKDIATNLYAGLLAATNNFTSYSVNPDTFETAASLLKLGALKKQVKKPVTQPQNAFFPQKKQTQLPPARKYEAPQESPKLIEKTDEEEDEKKKQEKGSPQDWLKPKIFRGTGIV